MNWKTLVYDYVHHRNQMDIDYSIEPLLTLVEDDAFLHAQIDRLARMRELAWQRQLRPVQNETRLSIVRTQVQAEEVIADVALKRTIVSQIRDEQQTERRIEYERLLLHRRGERWHIVQVQNLAGERSFLPDAGVFPDLLPVQESSKIRTEYIPSVPYLNYEVLGQPEPSHRRFRYDRGKAAQYADTWWNGYNPAYAAIEVDCTNFVSQCLFAGGAPMHYTGKRDSGWWYKGRSQGQELWSFSWAVAHSLQSYLTSSKRAVEVEAPNLLRLGDVLCYDWDGTGRFGHNTIVTAFDPLGMPLVNAHTISSQHRYWSYQDSHAWTPRTRYRFLHIVDG
ncbi:amidase domain-containing protein [Paenibacillus hamazuiensis]|uniref:amidase domain-containing protein n=1 Tax=Paenibacillus hamazuiensis TaxID=2936508 RepID=UPI00200C5CF2|nr:amidase domain-containing protein [Paenibacillus hamazuiensis]